MKINVLLALLTSAITNFAMASQYQQTVVSDSKICNFNFSDSGLMISSVSYTDTTRTKVKVYNVELVPVSMQEYLTELPSNGTYHFKVLRQAEDGSKRFYKSKITVDMKNGEMTGVTLQHSIPGQLFSKTISCHL